LDYCCGNGGTSIFLAKNGAQTIGIDISSQSIKNAKENAVQQGVERNLSFLVMHAENLQFDSGYFDLIACHGVLHHLNIQRAYSELARMLKPSGEIICAEPLVHNQITLI
jgi:ubiquinone/menaquinone biosynthesis C-methylase UbiE